jgi:GR25 family glycosyltransferase involved in LPS biosynthesis
MKAVIIRLKNNAISEKYADECIEQANKFNISLEKYDGINGLTYKDHLEKLNIKPLKKFKKGLPGIYGCFLSHYYIWKHCIDLNEPILVLEHDGYFIKQLPENILDRFDDILKLDSQNPYDILYNQVILDTFENNLEIKDIDNFLVDNGAGNYSWGTYAYIIKPLGAKKLINWIAQHGFLPADQQIGLNVLNVKTCYPPLVRLHPAYSGDNIYNMSTTLNTDQLTFPTDTI